jgi:hypothetical protein
MTRPVDTHIVNSSSYRRCYYISTDVTNPVVTDVIHPVVTEVIHPVVTDVIHPCLINSALVGQTLYTVMFKHLWFLFELHLD